MSSRTNISAPVQLSQPQFPVRHGTVLYQLLESSSKESNRCNGRINIKPDPPKPPMRMRRSNIPVPIARRSGNSTPRDESDARSHRRFQHSSLESVEQAHLIYACKPVESRKFEESLRKYDNESINRPSRSAPTSRLPSPIGRRPATTITAEVRRVLSRAKLSSYKETYDRHEVLMKEQEKRTQNKPPALPAGNSARARPIMKNIDCQTNREPAKTTIHISIDTQTDLNEDQSKIAVSEYDSNGNPNIEKFVHATGTQTETTDEDKERENSTDFDRLVKEQDMLCSQLAKQLQEKMCECIRLQGNVNSLKSQLESLKGVNANLQSDLSNSQKQEQDNKNASGDSQTVFVQTESFEISKFCFDKSTLTEEFLSNTPKLNYLPRASHDVDEEEVPKGKKLEAKSSLSAAKEWIDSAGSAGPPFDFSSLKSFSAEQFMRTPSCQDATLPTFMPVKLIRNPDPEPDQQVALCDQQSADEKNLNVLKAARSQLEEMYSQSDVHTNKFIQRIQRKKDEQARKDDGRSAVNEININPGEPCSRKRSSRKSNGRRKTVSFNGEASDSQEKLNVGQKSRHRRRRNSKSRSDSMEQTRHGHRHRSERSRSKDAISSTRYRNDWSPETARRKEKMINEVFNALHLSPKAKVDEVCGTLASHVIAIGSRFTNKEPSGETGSPERPRPKPRRRDLTRRSPATCFLKK